MGEGKEYRQMKEGQRRMRDGPEVAIQAPPQPPQEGWQVRSLQESLGMGLPFDILVKDLGPYGHVFPGMVEWYLPPCKPRNTDPQ